MSELANAIVATASKLGIDPADLATAISYETAGTFRPDMPGPKDSYGTPRAGLIQWGTDERKQYGVPEDMNVPGQMEAVGRYLTDRGVRPGMGMMDIYSAINAGRVGLYNRSDANNGGAPGTVADKVNNQMGAHRVKAQNLLGATSTPITGINQNPVGQSAPAHIPQIPGTNQNPAQGILAQAPAPQGLLHAPGEYSGAFPDPNAAKPEAGGILGGYVPQGGGQQMPLTPMKPLEHLPINIPPTLYQRARMRA